MAKDYNALFKLDSLAFMKKYSVVPENQIGGTGTYVADLNPNGTVPQKAGVTYEYKEMPANRLVGYLNFSKVPHTHPAGQTGQISVTGSYVPDPTKVEAHFLPWFDEAIIRLTIPPMPVGGGGTRYFFTAAINGCSVFIKGTPQSPTIFHAGGSTYTKTPQAGAKFWRDMMQTHNATSDPVAEVNKTMYVTDKKDKNKGTQHSREFASWLKESQGGTYMIEDVAPTGCVFGVRTAGLWAFYLQENISITYSSFVMQPKKFFGSKKAPVVGTTHVSVRPMQLRQIFPDGGGHVQFTPTLTRALKV